MAQSGMAQTGHLFFWESRNTFSVKAFQSVHWDECHCGSGKHLSSFDVQRLENICSGSQCESSSFIMVL